MWTHDHDLDEAALRPKADNAEHVDVSRLMHAAAVGRTDVLGPNMLKLQRSVGNAGTAMMVQREHDEEPAESPVLSVIRSSGSRMGDDQHQTVVQKLGADPGPIVTHTDSAAVKSAAAVGAHAYTVREGGETHIVGSSDVLSNESTLLHEAWHGVQQSRGPVGGTPTGDGIAVSDPNDAWEREAAEVGARAAATPVQALHVQRDACGGGDHSGHDHGDEAPVQMLAASGGPVVQREAEEDFEDDELPVQTLSMSQTPVVQREAEEDFEDDELPVQTLSISQTPVVQRETDEEYEDEG